MSTAKDKQALKNKMTVIWIIWGALFLSLFIYILVGHLMAGSLETNMLDQEFPMTLLTNILFAIGVSELVLAYVLKWFMLKQSGQSEPDISQAAGKYTVIVIISNAISESVGIYGLVLFFLTQDFQVLYTFMFISAMAMLYFRPKSKELETMCETDSEKSD